MRNIFRMTAAAAAALTLCSCSLLKYDDSEENSIGGYVVPAEFTEEELEMQKTVEQAAYLIRSAFDVFEGYYGDANEPSECKVIFKQPGDIDGEHTKMICKKTFSVYRNDLKSYKNQLKDSLTSEALARFSENFAIGEEVNAKPQDYWHDKFKENDDTPDVDTITITVTEGDMLGEDGSLTSFPHIIKLENIALYDAEAFKAVKALNGCFWNTAHITEKTDDTIKFAYIIETDGVFSERTGILKNEDGWKLSWYMDWLE